MWPKRWWPVQFYPGGENTVGKTSWLPRDILFSSNYFLIRGYEATRGLRHRTILEQDCGRHSCTHGEASFIADKIGDDAPSDHESNLYGLVRLCASSA